MFLAFIAWAAGKIDWLGTWHQVASASVREQLAMAGFWLVALFVRPARLLILIRATAPGIQRRYWPLWAGDMIGMATNNVIPMRAGELVMVVVLRRFFRLSVAEASSLVFVDRFFDLATVIAIAVATLFAAPVMTAWASDVAMTMIAALSLLSVGLWLLVRMEDAWSGPLMRLLDSAAPRKSTKLKASINDLVAGLRTMGSGMVLARALACSVVLWTAIVLSFWFGIRAVWPGVPLTAAAFAASAVSLSFIMPIVPAGFGVFHGAVVLALSLYGIPLEPALAFAVVGHVFQVGSVFLFATIAALCNGISIKSLVIAGEAER